MKALGVVAVLFAAVAAGCGGDGDGPLTVYSGREEELVAPLFEMFTEETGIEVEVRYGDSAELAATIAEEGDNSPADVFFAQDPGSLGSVESELSELPVETLNRSMRDFAMLTVGGWEPPDGRASSPITPRRCPRTRSGVGVRPHRSDVEGKVGVAPRTRRSRRSSRR